MKRPCVRVKYTRVIAQTITLITLSNVIEADTDEGMGPSTIPINMKLIRIDDGHTAPYSVV